MVVADECASLPVLAELTRVEVKEVGLAAEVLPVVGVLTPSLVVLAVDEGTPLSLEVVHVEVAISRILMDKPGFDIQIGVRKRAI